MLLNIVQCPGQPRSKKYPAQNSNTDKVEGPEYVKCSSKRQGSGTRKLVFKCWLCHGLAENLDISFLLSRQRKHPPCRVFVGIQQINPGEHFEYSLTPTTHTVTYIVIYQNHGLNSICYLPLSLDSPTKP